MAHMYGDLKGEFEVNLSTLPGSTDGRSHELQFIVRRMHHMTDPTWTITTRITKAELLQLRNAINAELDRVFLDVPEVEQRESVAGLEPQESSGLD